MYLYTYVLITPEWKILASYMHPFSIRLQSRGRVQVQKIVKFKVHESILKNERFET